MCVTRDRSLTSPPKGTSMFENVSFNMSVIVQCHSKAVYQHADEPGWIKVSPNWNSLQCCMSVEQQGRSRRFRSEGDKLFRGLLSDSSSSRFQLHLSLAAKEPHDHKQHSTREPTLVLLKWYTIKISNLKLPNSGWHRMTLEHRQGE